MEKKVLKQDDYKMSKWSGGNTRELAIYPEKADYISREFIWRLSSADSDLEESSFTKLPDFDRILMVLDGQVVLAHGDERTVKLGALEQDSFDGAVKTKCFGSLKKDYNLIMRKGCRGRMELEELAEQGKKMTLTSRKDKDEDGFFGECASYGIYALEGYTVVTTAYKDNVQTDMVQADQQMIINCQPGETVEITLMGEGKCIFTEVVFEKEYNFADGIDSQKAASGTGGSDFAWALKLSLTNNRWSNIMRQVRKNGIWMAPEVEKKLRMLDKFMIPAIVWIIGIMLCLCGIFTSMESTTVILIMIIFTLLDLLVINPLIYMAVLPKPIRAYIKNSADLNAYERQLYEEQITYDPHREKLMHKYRDRSGEEYSGMRDFLRKLNK